jgi:hypothetical protein
MTLFMRLILGRIFILHEYRRKQKMKDALKDLWYGKLCPHEAFLQSNDEYYQLTKAFAGAQDSLLKSLNKEQQRAYMLVESYSEKMTDTALFHAFCYGLRLGAALLQDLEKQSSQTKPDLHFSQAADT